MIDTHIPLFEGVLTNLDENQKNLIYWCKFYNQVVYSQPEKERPSDFVIDYDILLDDWLEQKRFKEEVKVSGVQRGSASNMQEVITFDT